MLLAYHFASSICIKQKRTMTQTMGKEDKEEKDETSHN